MSANRNIRLLEAYTVCLGAVFCLPVLVPYYRDVIGLSFQDFLIGEVVFAAVVFALEVPTGWLSDVWKRKYTLAAAALVWLLGWGMLLAADDLFMTVAAQGMLGVAVALFSGTNSAMMYDTLLEAGREAEYSRLEGRRQALSLYAIAVAAIIGGFAYALDPALPFLLSLAGGVPAFACAMAMREPARHRRAAERNPLADMARTMRYALRGHAEIGFIILFAALLFSATKTIMWTQQPYYMALGIPEIWYGVLMAVGWVLGGASAQAAHRLDGRVRNLPFLCFALGAALFVCIGASLGPGLHGVALLMVGGSCLYGIANPRVLNAINKRVDSSRRATILSTQNLMTQIAFIPLGLGIGALSERAGISGALLGIAAWLGLAGMCLAFWSQRRGRRTA